MAKRPKSSKADPMKDEGKPKSVRLELDRPEHMLLRVLAAKRGLSMAAFTRELVLRAIHDAFPSGDLDRN